MMISKKTISHQYHQLSIACAERRQLTAALRQCVLLQRLSFRGQAVRAESSKSPSQRRALYRCELSLGSEPKTSTFSSLCSEACTFLPALKNILSF